MSQAIAARTVRRAGRTTIVLLTTVAAVLAALLCFASGAMVGATDEFTSQGGPARVDAGTLVGFTAVPVGLGMTVAAVLSRWWRWVLPAALVVAPALALASVVAMPLQVDFDAPGRIALVAAHAVLAPVTVGGLLALRRLDRRRPA